MAYLRTPATGAQMTGTIGLSPTFGGTDITDMQAAAASTLFVGSIMLAIGVARGTLELLFWGCRFARAEATRQPKPQASGATRSNTHPLG